MSMRLFSSRKIRGFALVSAIAAVVGAVFVWTDIAAEFEARGWDFRLRIVADPAAIDPNVKLIVIDQRSLDFEANDPSRGIYWPWPRQMYVPVIEFLRRAGAKGVAFDILFTEQSSYGVEDDQALAAAVSGAMPVVFATALDRSAVLENPNDIDLFRKRLEALGPPNISELVRLPSAAFSAATLPIPELIAGAHAFGNVTAEPDSDGIFRRTSVYGTWQPRAAEPFPILNLPFALLEAVKAPVSDNLFATGLDQRGIVIGYHGAGQTYPTFPISQIIQSFVALEEGNTPQVPVTTFKDSYVFVGMTAPGLLDLRPSPLDRRFPGVEVNATVFDNAKNGGFIYRTSRVTDVLFAAAIGGVAALLGLFLTTAVVQLLAVVGWAALLGAGVIALAAQGIWIGVIPAIVALLVGVTGALVVQYQLEGRQHRFIRNAFRHYVSTAVIDKIVADPAALSLGGEKRELTIFFSDIAGFTSISEKLGANDLMALLNRYLTEMTDIIMQHSGTVDKYVGDAIVAFWNAPLHISDHAVQATKAALRCQARLAELRIEFAATYGVELRSRIGLHTGVVNVGNFGSRERFNYTVVGDAANLASRLEGANKYFGTEILMSADTEIQARGAIISRKIADITVVGKEEVIGVFEPLGAAGARTLTAAETKFAAALAAFSAARLAEAEALFQELPSDSVARIYLTRLSRDLRDPEHQQHWSPVWKLKEK